jgi:hypothetical protein
MYLRGDPVAGPIGGARRSRERQTEREWQRAQAMRLSPPASQLSCFDQSRTRALPISPFARHLPSGIDGARCTLHRAFLGHMVASTVAPCASTVLSVFAITQTTWLAVLYPLNTGTHASRSVGCRCTYGIP